MFPDNLGTPVLLHAGASQGPGNLIAAFFLAAPKGPAKHSLHCLVLRASQWTLPSLLVTSSQGHTKHFIACSSHLLESQAIIYTSYGHLSHGACQTLHCLVFCSPAPPNDSCLPPLHQVREPTHHAISRSPDLPTFEGPKHHLCLRSTYHRVRKPAEYTIVWCLVTQAQVGVLGACTIISACHRCIESWGVAREIPTDSISITTVFAFASCHFKSTDLPHNQMVDALVSRIKSLSLTISAGSNQRARRVAHCPILVSVEG